MRSIFRTATELANWLSGPEIPPWQEAYIADLQGSFVWTVDALGTDPLQQALVVPSSGAGTGKWLRRDLQFSYRVPINAALANNAALITVPTGFRLKILQPVIEVTTDFSGGDTPSVGINTNAAGSNAAGDLLGGETGMVAADLSTGFRGVPGPVYTSQRTIVLTGGQTIRWNKMTDTFAAGDGFLHVPVVQLHRNV